MKTYTIFILISLLTLSCTFETSSNDKTMKMVTTTSPVFNCNRCDKKIIEKAVENSDKLSKDDIKSFLCSFKKSCNWDELYQKSNATYKRVAFETFIVLFYKYFDSYLDILENNKELDLDYLLELLETPIPKDLPRDGILKKMNKLKTKTRIQGKIYKALDKAIKDGNIKIDITK